MEDPYDTYLAHYGVPGMKWGKRKNRSTSTSKSSRKKPLDLKRVDDKTLASKIKRLQMEKQYKELTAKPSGFKTAAKIAGGTLAAATAIDRGYKLYNGALGKKVRATVIKTVRNQKAIAG